MISEVELPLFTFGRFCDIIKVVRKLIDKLEFNVRYLCKFLWYFSIKKPYFFDDFPPIIPPVKYAFLLGW